jgi:anti-sigma regulatory factor (Ser/Thr protein kinase)
MTTTAICGCRGEADDADNFAYVQAGSSPGLPPDLSEVLMTNVSSADAREPAPMRILLPAIPASLAVIRAHLRRWLPTAEVNASTAADVLLAVGEAASNAVEHAVRGAARNVVVEVTARATDTGLALTVKDNGRWHAPPPSPQGYRGHGSRLMRALVDTVTITPTPQGTTVEMRKELKA